MHVISTFTTEAFLRDYVIKIVADKGVWTDNKFVPYHRIDGIEDAGETK